MLSIAKKLAIAGATSGTTFLLTRIAHAELVWTLTLAVFLGGVALVVQFLLDFEKTLAANVSMQQSALVAALAEQQSTVDSLQRAVTDSLRTVNEATRLLTTIDQSPLDHTQSQARPVTQFVRAVAEFKPSAPVLNKLAIEELRAMTRLLEGLRGGSASYPGEDRDWMLSLTRSATSRISATSTSAVDGGKRSFSDGFWRSELGRSYLQAQKEAVDRGVEVRRVFILNRASTLTSKDFVTTCEEQRNIGILVKAMVVPNEGAASWTTTFRDFILFDDAVSYEPELSTKLTSRSSIASTHLRVDRVRVEERRAQFEEIWMAADSKPGGPVDST